MKYLINLFCLVLIALLFFNITKRVYIKGEIRGCELDITRLFSYTGTKVRKDTIEGYCIKLIQDNND